MKKDLDKEREKDVRQNNVSRIQQALSAVGQKLPQKTFNALPE
jgi:hypothetical protein